MVNDLPSFFMEQSFITVQLLAGGLHKSAVMEMALDLFGFGGNRKRFKFNSWFRSFLSFKKKKYIYVAISMSSKVPL